MRARSGEESVSVIVGTLLLILITVTAAAGLAIMVSQIQKDEMNRQTHLNAVKNEQVSIMNVMFSSDPADWSVHGGVTGSRYWNNVTIKLVNLNTDDVRITGIAINDRYALNITDKSLYDTTGAPPQIWNLTTPVIIKGTQSQDVYVDFISNSSVDPFIYYREPQMFDVTKSQDIKILTSLNNFFEKTLKPPIPLAQVKMETDDLGTVQRDALVLDGSQSSADNTVISWNWSIYDASNTVPPGNWSDVTNWSIPYQTPTGKIVRLNTLKNSPYYRVTLTVRDDLGMSATSDPICLPQGQFSPTTYLNLALSPPVPVVPNRNQSVLFANLSDIEKNPVQGKVITFIIDRNPNIPQNCFSIDKMANVTDNNGVAYAFVTLGNDTSPDCPQPVTVYAQFGKLISPTVMVSSP